MTNNGNSNNNGSGFNAFDPMGMLNHMMNGGSDAQFGIDIGITGPDGNKKNINVPIPDVAKMFQNMNLPGNNNNNNNQFRAHPFQNNTGPSPASFGFQHNFGPFHAGFSTSDNKSPENQEPSKKKKHDESKDEKHRLKKMHKQEKKRSKHEQKENKGFKVKKKGRNIDNLARFSKHETYPDETEVEIGSKFIKIWTLRNDGLMSWPKVCDLLQIGGEDLSPNNFSFTALTSEFNNLNLNVNGENEIRPGDEVQIKVELTAPLKPGFYETYFRLKAVDPNSEANGFRFGQRLWCKINVIEPVIQSLSDSLTDSSISDSSDTSETSDQEIKKSGENGEKIDKNDANGHANSKQNLQKNGKNDEKMQKKEKKLQKKANKLRKKLAKIEKKLIKVQRNRVKKQEKKIQSKENEVKSDENKEKPKEHDEAFEVITMEEE